MGRASWPQGLMVLKSEHGFYPRSGPPCLYVLGGAKLTPRDPALQISMSQTSPVITKETTMWRCLGGLQRGSQHGTYFVRLGFRFSRIGSPPTLLSVTVSGRCRAGNVWRFCCARQGLFFQCPSHRRQHFFGLLCRQHRAIARLIQNPVPGCVTETYVSYNRSRPHHSSNAWHLCKIPIRDPSVTKTNNGESRAWLKNNNPLPGGKIAGGPGKLT
jgi:hypothetical protein